MTYKVYQPTYIGSGTRIGEGTKICAFCDIGKNVEIGCFCLIQNHVSMSNGAHVGNYVFIGPGARLLDIKYPPKRSNRENDSCRVEDHATIGAGAIILPGVIVGEYALVGAGSVVTKNVEARHVVCGNPAENIVCPEWRLACRHEPFYLHNP